MEALPSLWAFTSNFGASFSCTPRRSEFVCWPVIIPWVHIIFKALKSKRLKASSTLYRYDRTDEDEGNLAHDEYRTSHSQQSAIKNIGCDVGIFERSWLPRHRHEIWFVSFYIMYLHKCWQIQSCSRFACWYQVFKKTKTHQILMVIILNFDALIHLYHVVSFAVTYSGRLISNDSDKFFFGRV